VAVETPNVVHAMALAVLHAEASEFTTNAEFVGAPLHMGVGLYTLRLRQPLLFRDGETEGLVFVQGLSSAAGYTVLAGIISEAAAEGQRGHVFVQVYDEEAAPTDEVFIGNVVVLRLPQS
jgi:hypothetical protein